MQKGSFLKTLHRLLPLTLALLLTALPSCSLRSSENDGGDLADNSETVALLSPDTPSDSGTSSSAAEPVSNLPADEPVPVQTAEELPSVVPAGEVEGDADFYPDGIFIYGDSVYTQAYYSETNSRYFAQTALYYQQKFGTQVSIVLAPLSSMVIHSDKLASIIPDQRVMLNDMKALTDPAVNFVNTYDALAAHDREYLYFHTDHHWTQRGAYYAYEEFAKSVGLTPVSLEDLNYVVRNDNYLGSMYEFTKDERVKTFKDQVEAWYPTKSHSMLTVTPQGETINYDSSIVSVNNGYVTFIAGDNAYTEIYVPDNPQDMTCLVLKDSFGNAFVPFLVEHYGTIVVVDPRFTEENIYDKYAWLNFRDIIFVNNIEAANSYVWSKLYMAAVGQYMP